MLTLILLLHTFCFSRDALLEKSSPKVSPTTRSDSAFPEKSQNATKPVNDTESNKPRVAALDVFGTSRLDEKSLRAFLGADLDLWFTKGLAADPTSVQLENQLKDKVKKKYDFAVVDWSIVQFFQPGPVNLYITLDVVENSDVATRMPFYPVPQGQFSDPDNLIKQWMEYEDTALALIEQGELDPEVEKCPAFHCPFGHKHLKLKKFERIFTEGVRKHEKELVEIAKNSKNAADRGSSLYLLAYLKDGKKVASLMIDRIKDPDEVVRNNALRVLGDIAELHPEIDLPSGVIIQALKFPRVTDRAKALYCLYHLSSTSKKLREELLQRATPDLLKLLETSQPDQSELAHGILRRISGKDFSRTDLRSWSQWAEQSFSKTALGDNQKSVGTPVPKK